MQKLQPKELVIQFIIGEIPACAGMTEKLLSRSLKNATKKAVRLPAKAGTA